MTRAEIVEEISQGINHLHKKDINQIIVLLLETIQDKVIDGETIYLRGFGTFGSKIRKQRIARNMKTGESITVPEHSVPYFRAGKELKELKQQSKKQNARKA
ncbi:MAG: integration host factor subunit beta [bacterium]|nr:integration host factor subunit beta [bacterium]